MLPVSDHLPTDSLNLRIISEGLFQPILQLNLTKNSSGNLCGIANLTLKELGRVSDFCFRVHGNYKTIPHSTRILVKLKGDISIHKTSKNQLSIDMEMDKEWTTGIATYQYQIRAANIIRNATVSSVLFTQTQFKTQKYSLSFY
ncbi:DUF1842 domain-containing protein [Pedobacter caeni]|uniref:DUF1842 domain-containing protein n=1 Tax=Pedobacter caeni TaxID=288992 RepID=A0A1M5JWT2_9SPHI|nr:DUF1842 domain-containing protein [Pedobacter caeni]SHG45011.1 protein of unknown function [Pedobacter caeni]